MDVVIPYLKEVIASPYELLNDLLPAAVENKSMFVLHEETSQFAYASKPLADASSSEQHDLCIDQMEKVNKTCARQNDLHNEKIAQLTSQCEIDKNIAHEKSKKNMASFNETCTGQLKDKDSRIRQMSSQCKEEKNELVLVSQKNLTACNLEKVEAALSLESTINITKSHLTKEQNLVADLRKDLEREAEEHQALQKQFLQLNQYLDTVKNDSISLHKVFNMNWKMIDLSIYYFYLAQLFGGI